MLLLSLKVTTTCADACSNQSALMYVELMLEFRRNYCQAVVHIFEKQKVFLKEAVGTPILVTNNNNTKIPFGQVHVCSNLPSLH